jgi:hypothetical protein
MFQSNSGETSIKIVRVNADIWVPYDLCQSS